MDSMVMFNDGNLFKKIKQFILEGIGEAPLKVKSDPFWKNLRKSGSEIWLDTGDIDEAKEVWSSEMTALTTNNTLLNKEIQKGIYDNYILQAREIVKDLPLKEQVILIAFILNARHGLRLTKIFNGFVSVELHTDTANDFNAIIEFGRHYYDISPERFVVKVPYTATGLLGARRLREMDVKVNLTLEFSTRQNILVAAVSQPDYCNVFMGRLGSYIKDNNLGNGTGAGEKAVLNAQKLVKELTRKNKHATKLIAASLRSADQLEKLAGVDVFTIPVKVALAAKTELNGNFSPKLNEIFPVDLNSSAEGAFVEKLWEVKPGELSLAKHLGADVPQSTAELIGRTYDAGCRDLFPVLDDREKLFISQDGKIPKHERWKERIQNEDLAIDTLLNLAGLESFATDQALLDGRIENLIT